MATNCGNCRLRILLSTVLLASAAFAQTDALLEKADAAFREGNADLAESTARRVLARSPNTVHAHMILGVIAAQKNDWTASTRHFQSVIRIEPSNPFGYFYLGQAALYQRQWERGIQFFTKALALQYPEPERLMIELALAQQEAGRPDEALATLDRATVPTDNRQAAQYYAVRAFALAKIKGPVPAIDAIRRALALDDSNSRSWAFLISTLIAGDLAPQALANAIRAQQKFPDDPDVQFLFALASYQVPESPLGKLALRNLQEAEPGSPRVLLAEGLVYRKSGETEKAEAAFRRAAQQGVPDAHLLLGIVCSESGRNDEAEREYREAERLNPQNGQVQLELGKLLASEGKLEEGRVYLERALTQLAESPAVHYQLGVVYRKLGLDEKSKFHLKMWKTVGSSERSQSPVN